LHRPPDLWLRVQASSVLIYATWVASRFYRVQDYFCTTVYCKASRYAATRNSIRRRSKYLKNSINPAARTSCTE